MPVEHVTPAIEAREAVQADDDVAVEVEATGVMGRHNEASPGRDRADLRVLGALSVNLM